MPCKPNSEPNHIVGKINFGTGPIAKSLLDFQSHATGKGVVKKNIISFSDEPSDPCICGKQMVLRNRTVSYSLLPGDKFWWCGGCGAVAPCANFSFPDEFVEEQRARKVWEEENKE